MAAAIALSGIGGYAQAQQKAKDIGEKNDLAAAEPAIRDKMTADLKNWILSCGAIIPELNTDFDSTKWDQRVNPKKEE